tara:strand:- start:11302 stop:11484 length:183 start_codon:yes stop_codon:yes gene_type:complete
MSSNKEFRLQVLKMTLETGSGRTVDDPLDRADKFLEWCMKEDKPAATAAPKASTKNISKK